MEVTRESEGPARRLRGHMSPKGLAGTIECLDCGAEQGEAGWEHVHYALPHVKFRGRPQDGPQGRDRQRSPEDDCSLRSLDASYAELTASFAALRLFRGNMMSRQTSGWTSISSVSLPCLEAAAPKARVDPLRAGGAAGRTDRLRPVVLSVGGA